MPALDLDGLEAQAGKLLQLYRQGNIEAGQATDQPQAGDYPSEQALAEQHLAELKRLWSAQIFVGTRPALLAAGVVGVVLILLSILYGLKVPGLPGTQLAYPIAAGLGLVVAGFAERGHLAEGQVPGPRNHGDFQECSPARYSPGTVAPVHSGADRNRVPHLR